MPIIYRWGNNTPSNFTPRPADNDGLSTNTAMPNVRAQVINSANLVDTQAVQTGAAGHYSIQPNVTAPNLPDAMALWQGTRADFTQANNNWAFAGADPQYFRTVGVNAGRTGQVN